MADLTIADVRKKYPQYGDMSDQALGEALHKKYYADIPFEQFSAKIGLGPDKSVPDSTPASQSAREPVPQEIRESNTRANAEAGRQYLNSGSTDERAEILKVTGLTDAQLRAAAGKPEKSWAERADAAITGGGEAVLSLLTGATTGMVGRAAGAVGGIAGSVATGRYGTQAGAKMAEQTAEEGAAKLTFEPKSEEGKAALEAIGRFMDKTKLAGLGPAEAVAAGNVRAAPVRPVVGHAARVLGRDAAEAAKTVFRNDMQEGPLPSTMAGGGSAVTDPAAIRRARAEALPVPIKLTKAQATRDFADQQFERETAKNAKVGEPLRERYADQNEKILQNFDAWVDQTGAEAGSLRATGQAVSEAVVNKSNKAKTEIRSAYKSARESGDMQERIDAGPLQRYLDEHQPEAINAPVLTSTEAKLARVLREDGTVSINDLEEVRKMVGRLSGKDATNATFGGEVKQLIDSLTEGKGGDLYKKARGLRTRYAREFEDHAVIDKLLSKKPGTRDRSVAFEDVFDHSIMKGSLDDVRAMRKTLQTAGTQGEQAWKELQGAGVKHLKDEITKNVARDQKGNPVVSPARLNTLVNELDKDGKLDFIYGKKGAQQIRDVNGIAQDLFTAPPGSVNTSNTASILIGLLDTAVSGVSGMPLPIGSAVNFGVRKVKDSRLEKRVRSHLADPEERP